MQILLVQGTWGDDDHWWRPGGAFHDALVAEGHTIFGDDRPFEWSTSLGGVGFGNRDLNVWRAAGRHLYDRLVPPQCPEQRPTDLVIIAHSHGRQVVKYALHYGVTASQVVFVSGPIRKDVDRETPGARANVEELICINGGRRDRMQWLGELFDGHLGVKRNDPEADYNLTIPEADHGSLLRDPTQFHHILSFLHKPSVP